MRGDGGGAAISSCELRRQRARSAAAEASVAESIEKLLIPSSALALYLDNGRALASNAVVSDLPLQRCPRCGAVLADIKGSRMAVCRRCGYKDDCC